MKTLSIRMVSVGKALGQPVEWAGRVAAVLTLVLVLLMAGNVGARYLFDMSSVAMQELEWHLISPIALIGMSYALRAGEHVRVDVLYERFNNNGRHFVDIISALLMVALSITMVVLTLPYIEQSYSMSEGSPDPGGLPDRWILKAFILLGFALLVLQGLSQAITASVALLDHSDSAK